MNEMKIATWRFPADKLIPALGGAKMLDVDMSSHPDLVEHLADWTPVSHQVIPIEDGGVLFSVLLHRAVEAPNSPGEMWS